MKRTLFSIFCSFAFMLIWFSPAKTIENQPNNPLPVIQEVMHSATSVEEAISLSEQYSLVYKSFSESGYALYEFDSGMDLITLENNGFYLNAYSQTDDIDPIGMDDLFNHQQYYLDQTHTDLAWNITKGSEEVLVAVLDSGIDVNHEDLIGRISPLSINIDTNVVGLTDLTDENGHGTAVSGIIAANQNNQLGISGIADNVIIMMVKLNTPGGAYFSDANIIDGVKYATDHGADIINMSFGGTYRNPLVELALRYAKDAGVLLVGASGNDGTEIPHYPASFTDVISVGSISTDNIISDFSNFGATLDIVAYGEYIVTTYPDSDYIAWSGTSFAAPMVSGILALYKSYYPDSTSEEVLNDLYASSLDLGIHGKDERYGYGLIDAYLFLKSGCQKVEFMTDGGTVIPDVFVQSGEPLSMIPTPEKSGYIFQKWYLDADHFFEFNPNQLFYSDITLYAGYIMAQYHHVNYVMTESITIEANVLYNTLFTPYGYEREGYRLLGWYEDPAFTTLFEPKILTGDITLYAKWEEVFYFDVTYYVENELYLQTTAEQYVPFEPMAWELFWLELEGWYLDAQLTIPYTPSELTGDLTLYAKTSIPLITVYLMHPTTGMEELIIQFGEFVQPETPEYPNHTFLGWYYDIDGSNPYENEPLFEDTILYALFQKNYVTVTYLNTELGLYYPIDINVGDPLDIGPIDLEGYDFIGWFYDLEGTLPVGDDLASENLLLFGLYTRHYYTVTFYNFDFTTVYYQTTVAYEDEVTFPLDPEYPSNELFDFHFSRWSLDNKMIFRDMDVYPYFDKILKPEAATLAPCVDLVYVGTVYEDQGLILMSDDLSYKTFDAIDTSIPSEQTITYEIYYQRRQVGELVRVVTVVPQPVSDVFITLNKGISTLYLGDAYVEMGANASEGTITVIGSVNVNVAGVYQIIYRVTKGNIDYEKSRYVHVLDKSVPISRDVFYVARKEDDFHA